MPIDLNDPRILEAFKWHTKEAALFDLPFRAHQIVLGLSRLLVEVPVERAEMQSDYQNILAQSKFISLPFLKESDILELIQNNLMLIFEMPDYDLWEKIKTKLISIPIFEDRDTLKKKIKEALLLNDQSLTEEPLLLEEKKIKGTLKNWLTDYNRLMGFEKVSALKLSEYLLSSPNAKNLSAGSRKKLEYLLKFYEKLKFSSLEFEGIEELMIFNVEGEIDIYEGGIIERIGRKEKEALKQLESLETLGEIKGEVEAKYRGFEKEAEEKEIAKILKATAGNFGKLANELLRTITVTPGKAPNKIKIAAILKILAEKGELEKILEKEKFNEMMIAYFREKGKTLDLEGFKVNPRAPQYVAAFLKHILMDIAGMSEDESGRLGMQLFNLLKKGSKDDKYKGLVYFDLSKKEFCWSTF